MIVCQENTDFLQLARLPHAPSKEQNAFHFPDYETEWKPALRGPRALARYRGGESFATVNSASAGICRGDEGARRVITFASLGVSVEIDMPCRICNSERVSTFQGELSASSPRLEDVKKQPIYVCEQLLVCLDCGFSELKIPPGKLEMLKLAAPDGKF